MSSTVEVLVDGKVEHWPATMMHIAEDPFVMITGSGICIAQPVPDDREGYLLLQMIDGKWHAIRSHDA